MSRHNAITVSRTLAISLAVTTAIALAGCSSSPLDVINEMAENAAAEVVEQDSASDAPDSGIDPADIVDLPSDFPAEVPLLDGPITSATSLDMKGLGYWSLHIRTPDAAAAMKSVREELAAAGFEEQAWNEVGGLVSGTFVTDHHRVAVQSAGDIDGEMLMYTVTELSE